MSLTPIVSSIFVALIFYLQIFNVNAGCVYTGCPSNQYCSYLDSQFQCTICPSNQYSFNGACKSCPTLPTLNQGNTNPTSTGSSISVSTSGCVIQTPVSNKCIYYTTNPNTVHYPILPIGRDVVINNQQDTLNQFCRDLGFTQASESTTQLYVATGPDKDVCVYVNLSGSGCTWMDANTLTNQQQYTSVTCQ
jgi:hypothetical protein